MEMPTFEEQVSKQVDFWKDILSLRDWNTGVRVVRQWELDDEHTIAQVDYNLRKKDAILKVLSPKDLDRHASMSVDGEERDYDVHIAHELLHLHFAPLQLEGKQNEIGEEQAVHSIGRGLVRLYRHNETLQAIQPAPEVLTEPVKPTGHYI